jgi:hypothetical protein
LNFFVTYTRRTTNSIFFAAGLLFFALVLSACPNGNEEAGSADIWSDVTTPDQIVGTWMGSAAIPLDFSRDYLIETGLEAMVNPFKTSVVTDLAIVYEKDAEEADIASKIHLETALDAALKNLTVPARIALMSYGILNPTKELIWPLITSQLAPGQVETNIEFGKDGEYWVQVEDAIPVSELLGSVVPLQINQNGTKLKIKQDAAGMLEDAGASYTLPVSTVEIILVKQ